MGDDEIDYTLWDPAHPNGTTSYGQAIESLPLIEAVPDETQVMRHKLVTLPKSTAKMPIVEVIGGPFTFTNPGDSVDIVPNVTIVTMNNIGYCIERKPSNKRELKTLLIKTTDIPFLVKNTFRDKGTLLPSKDKTPKEKAISVADGIAHPFKVSLSPKLI